MQIKSLLGEIDIISVAGCQTRIIIPKYKSVFDMGFNDDSSNKYQNVFVSHSHADHVSGIWHHAAMQDFIYKREGHYYAPEENTGLIRAYIEAGKAMNHWDNTKALIKDIEPRGKGAGVSVGNGVSIYSFETSHRIPSCGFLGVSKKSKLKSEYIDYPSFMISDLVKNNVSVTDELETIEFAYSGDTRIESIVGNEDVLNSHTLILECTHFSKKSVEGTRNSGHIHIDEIIHYHSSFKNREIMLMHFSKMYCKEEIEKEVLRIPEELRCRVKIAI